MDLKIIARNVGNSLFNEVKNQKGTLGIEKVRAALKQYDYLSEWDKEYLEKEVLRQIIGRVG